MKHPRISVILPIYNGQKYLAAAIQSILSQTYADFELIIIDDGSSDDSAQIVRSCNDRRIIFSQQKNAGLAATLNIAIRKSHGEYIARQDQDDVSLPQRLQKQLDFMDRNQDVGVSGTWAQVFDGDQPTDRFLKHPTNNAGMQFDLLFDNVLVHSSVMMRRSALHQAGLYSTDKKRQPPEDYELWSRVAMRCQLANLGEVLLQYREMSGSMSRVGQNPFIEHAILIAHENIARALHKEKSDPAVRALAELFHRAPEAKIASSFAQLKKSIQTLMDWAMQFPGADEKELRQAAQNVMTRVDHHFPRSPLGRLIYGTLYRIEPNLINQRKAVRI